jgi:single-stranded-DNA-specific exonuclease
LLLKKWILNSNICTTNDAEIQSSCSKLVSVVLNNRGLREKEQIDKFFEDTYQYNDPFKLKDMDKAIDRISQAIEDEQKIVIYGDYDVDGITSTVILFLYLSYLGADVDFYIPSRDKEGYGLSIEAINKLASENTQLIITVDNGITAIEEVKYANSIGIDVVITDHHKSLEVLPPAVAVVDPHRKDCNSGYLNLAGVGVVFKLICALDGDSANIMENYGDLIAIGTVADVMCLVGENRKIVKEGLRKLNTCPSNGVKALLDIITIKNGEIKSEDISFKIAPRINASSRMNQINLAVELFLSENYEQALDIARQIDKCNVQRKEIEDKMLEEIDKKISENPSLLNSRILIIDGYDWNHSIAGINASKVLSKYDKPVIIISADGEQAKGSGRSIEGFSLIDAILAGRECLEKFGGHTLAAGFTMNSKNIDLYKSKVESYAKQVYREMPVQSYKIDAQVQCQDITIKNITDLKFLEPFGMGNEKPQFLLKDAIIVNVKALSGGKYTKICVNLENKANLDLLAFGIAYDDFIYQIGDKVDLLVHLDVSEYNQIISPAILVKDIRFSDFNQDEYFFEWSLHQKFKQLDLLKEEKEKLVKYLPTREDVAIVYKFLKTMKDYKYSDRHSLVEYLYIKLRNVNISYFKIQIILDVLEDINILDLSCGVCLPQVQGKTDISNSKTYQLLVQ